MRCLVPHLTLMPQQSLRASSDTYTLCCGGRMQHEEANVVQATATPYTDRFCVINVFVMLRQDLREHARPRVPGQVAGGQAARQDQGDGQGPRLDRRGVQARGAAGRAGAAGPLKPSSLALHNGAVCISTGLRHVKSSSKEGSHLCPVRALPCELKPCPVPQMCMRAQDLYL